MDTLSLDKKFVSRGSTPLPIDIARADGAYLYDRHGKRYIDFIAGWSVGNVGWNNPEIKKILRRFQGPDYVSPMYVNRLWATMARELVHLAPPGLTKVYFTTGGTESVEYALQAAMSTTGRHRFISIEGGYHGHSIGAMSIGDSGFRKKYTNLLFHCNKIRPPLEKAAALKVVKLLRQRNVAAYISEPIICNLAVEKPTPEYFKIVQAACKKFGTVFIMDEVATGFGRTGKMFASEYYRLRPDIMCLAKGLTGGYSVLGAVVMNETVSRAMRWGFSFYSTFGGHPLNTAIALANVHYLAKHRRKLLTNANNLSAYFIRRLNAMKFPQQPEIRVAGLAIGLQFGDATYANNLKNRCIRNGLLVADANAGSIVMFPALTITKRIAKQGLDLLEENI